MHDGQLWNCIDKEDTYRRMTRKREAVRPSNLHRSEIDSELYWAKCGQPETTKRSIKTRTELISCLAAWHFPPLINGS